MPMAGSSHKLKNLAGGLGEPVGMSKARYAVYYVPPNDSELAAFGRQWLGMDIETGNPVPQTVVDGIEPERLHQLTESPRLYGFHGTLKPPFYLAPRTTLNGLLSAARTFAKSVKPIEIPALELAVIGKFLALTSTVSSAELEALASECVRTLEVYRTRLTPQQMAQYRQNKLTVHQEQMLEHWGYPYVLEEFRFHISLTNRIDDDEERAKIQHTVRRLCRPLLGKTVPVSEIVVCGQKRWDKPMTVIERIPFGRK